jgi:pyrroloquinoline quinone (PQQ) biosynthesis protein C
MKKPIASPSFYHSLQQKTEDGRLSLLSAPLIQSALAGKLSLSEYVAFLTQAYHHVKYTTPLLMAVGARLPDSKEWLRENIAHYIEEELGHQEWILNDIRACGGDAEAVRISTPSLPAELMIRYVRDFIAHSNPVGFFGMVYVLEGTSVNVATQAADRIRESLDLPKSAFSYLYSHGSLDIEHLGFFEDLVNKIDSEQDQQDIVHVAGVIFTLYGDMFRSLKS